MSEMDNSICKYDCSLNFCECIKSQCADWRKRKHCPECGAWIHGDNKAMECGLCNSEICGNCAEDISGDEALCGGCLAEEMPHMDDDEYNTRSDMEHEKEGDR